MGALLARERASLGLTQVQLAKRAGMTQAAVSRSETGSSSPGMRSLQRLAAALGLGFTLVLQRGDQAICEVAGGGPS
ncbi:helix-turn-helix domain-containing protein [Streptacidiphilus rugosus]|uniref:helix-turn-helix domain-containing protein n=1 Tax=Streptacidiphilus rugosus TaxID=405783 RepID=UPI001E63964B|nr:helix-turn-helix transcriptional regulator [Streptacidiphilus rugosus]